MVELEADNSTVMRALASAARRPVAHSLTREVGGELDRVTSLAALREHGVPGVGLLALGGTNPMTEPSTWLGE